jgi:hypothetical protein
MKEFLMNAQVIAFILVSLAIVYSVFIRPILIKRFEGGYLTNTQLTLLDFACKKGVEYAEQLYKNDDTLSRNELALTYAFDIIEEAGIFSEEYLHIIEGLVESNVLKLPKTHAVFGDLR